MVETAIKGLFYYCRSNNWAGYDPYDALNSEIIRSFSFFDSRFPRLVLTQLLKKSPLNFRPLLKIPKTHNPKALALFLSSFIKLSKLGVLTEGTSLIQTMVDKIAELRSPGSECSCWGYSFPWQTRELLVPRGAPNVVCTVFVANALLDAYEETKISECLDMAKSAADYLIRDLFWAGGYMKSGFSYPLPTIKANIHNANLLGSALLCRVFHYTKEDRFLDPAIRVARYSVSKQNPDGSWNYGELPRQRWVDNFHTGYNLMALRDINLYGSTSEFLATTIRGFEYYIKNFFRDDGAPKYYNDRTYPIDIHCVAQSIITILAFRDIDEKSDEILLSVFWWAMTHMWDRRGFFYFQIIPAFKNRIPYMRWSQAWMLLALSSLLEVIKDSADPWLLKQGQR